MGGRGRLGGGEIDFDVVSSKMGGRGWLGGGGGWVAGSINTNVDLSKA